MKLCIISKAQFYTINKISAKATLYNNKNTNNYKHIAYKVFCEISIKKLQY